MPWTMNVVSAVSRIDIYAATPCIFSTARRAASARRAADRLACELELGGLARLARLVVADAEVLQQLLVAATGLVLHVHVRVERDERAVAELAERVDLRERHVVLDEQPR